MPHKVAAKAAPEEREGRRGKGKESRVQDEAVRWTLRIRPVAHLIAVHK